MENLSVIIDLSWKFKGLIACFRRRNGKRKQNSDCLSLPPSQDGNALQLLADLANLATMMRRFVPVLRVRRCSTMTHEEKLK